MIQSSRRGFFIIPLLCVLAFSAADQRPRSDLSKEQYVTVLKALSEKDYVKAVAVSKMLIERTHGYDRAYQRMIEASKKLGTLSQTKEYFQGSGSFNPLADYGLGLTQQQMEEHKAAVASFQKCLATSPGFLPAYRALVDSYSVLSHMNPPENRQVV